MAGSPESVSWTKLLGERLAMLRGDRGWTLEVLAERSGVSKATISKLEGGLVQEPRLSTLLLLQDGFGLGSLDPLLALSPSQQMASRIREDRQREQA